MSHDKDTYDNYKRYSARVPQRDWRLNDDGVIEDMVRQVKGPSGKWIAFTGGLALFYTHTERRVIWRARK